MYDPAPHIWYWQLFMVILGLGMLLFGLYIIYPNMHVQSTIAMPTALFHVCIAVRCHIALNKPFLEHTSTLLAGGRCDHQVVDVM